MGKVSHNRSILTGSTSSQCNSHPLAQRGTHSSFGPHFGVPLTILQKTAVIWIYISVNIIITTLFERHHASNINIYNILIYI